MVGKTRSIGGLRIKKGEYIIIAHGIRVNVAWDKGLELG